jgi:short-subunit dehydrogenase
MEEAALITGASRGIGFEIARCFAKDGHNCVLVARSEDELYENKQELESTQNVDVKVIAKDLTAPSAPEDIKRELDEDGVFVHSLVNNAGFGNHGRFTDNATEAEEALINLNVTALTSLTHRFAKPMVEAERGRIMNVASTGAFFPAPYLATYNASKAYVLSFTEAMAGELGEYNIKVSCLCPGATSTKFVEEAGRSADAAASSIPDFVWADPENVARYGYKSLNRGKVVAVHGWMNSLLMTAIRFVPRSFIRWAVGRAQRRSVDE